ncbi:hypothetical protein BJ912DRAFT_408681 [Pholiota molesta]|nr:hypothetical protein BJ912DRAFT_408681 [Pholiota molesta]
MDVTPRSLDPHPRWFPLNLPPTDDIHIQIDLVAISTKRAWLKTNLRLSELSKAIKDPETQGDPAMTRIFFITDPSYGDSEQKKPGDARPPLNSTAMHLHRHLGVPLLLYQHMSPTLEYRSTGSGFYAKYNDKDKCVALEGIYHLSQGLDDRPAYVWFSYSVLMPQTSTYVIYNCSAVAKKLLVSCAQTQEPPTLLRPFAVDTFLVEDMLETWTVKLSKFRTRLIGYEEDQALFSHTAAHNARAVADLHNLSQNLNVVVGNLIDYKDRNQFFISARERYLSLLAESHFHMQERSIGSITDALGLLTSRATMLMTWATNYNERTKIRINMFFNLTTQGDSRTNLDIARLTTKIAVASQKDSSSMITIAAVTMFFLPGSFVCAVFSMVFFDSHPGTAGRMELSVAPQWWLFPSITIPLTIIAFIIWLIWRRRRLSALQEVDVRVQPIEASFEDMSSTSSDTEKLRFSP